MSYHTRLTQTWDVNPKSRDQPDLHAQPLERRESEKQTTDNNKNQDELTCSPSVQEAEAGGS